MLPMKLPDHAAPSAKGFIKALFTVLLLTSYLYSSFAYALDLNIDTLIENFSGSVPQLMQLVTAFAYVAGMFMIYKGIMLLKQYGESRTMMSSQHELKGPIIFMMVGAALLYLPSSVQSGLNTFWTNPTPLAYVNDANGQWSTLINDSYLIMQLIGTIAFIRGLMILSHLGAAQGQPGQFGKGLAHLVGGILCINMYQFIRAVANTLGLSV